jgi:ParB-like chromosome segregation protein Spo0J
MTAGLLDGRRTGGVTEAIVPVPVACCRASPTARPVRAVKVAELARSIAEIGLRQPISVRPLGGGDYEVRGGNHCLAAIVELGHAVMPAIVREDDDLRAELAELDENLVRNDLSLAERAVAVARRKAIYEALHPETAHGATGKKRPKTQSRQVGDSNGVDDFAKLPTSSNVNGRRKETRRQLGDESGALRFTQATAEATGASERTIQREAERGEKIGEEVLRKVAGTSLDKGEELDGLARLPEEKRAEIADRAAAGEKVSAKSEAKKHARETREAELAERQQALPGKRYGVILGDPEWRFVRWSRETGMDRAADNHCPTSATEAIAARPVADIAAPDCVRDPSSRASAR